MVPQALRRCKPCFCKSQSGISGRPLLVRGKPTASVEVFMAFDSFRRYSSVTIATKETIGWGKKLPFLESKILWETLTEIYEKKWKTGVETYNEGVDQTKLGQIKIGNSTKLNKPMRGTKTRVNLLRHKCLLYSIRLFYNLKFPGIKIENIFRDFDTWLISERVKE